MAALNMDEIMDAATDGNYKLNVGFQYPGRPGYTDAGKETYNQHDPAKAKALLAKAGYKGEPVTILTNKDYTSMYNAAVVQAEQMKAVGINAEIQVVDWPTSIQMFLKGDTGWNYFHTGWGTQPALGALSTMAFFAPPNATYRPAAGKDDPDVVKLWHDMNNLPDAAGRQDAFVRLQAMTLDRGLRPAVRQPDQGAGGARQREGLRAVPHPALLQRVGRRSRACWASSPPACWVPSRRCCWSA